MPSVGEISANTDSVGDQNIKRVILVPFIAFLFILNRSHKSEFVFCLFENDLKGLIKER